METKEIKRLLRRYFNGESTGEEEKILENYFASGNVAGELREYAGFFAGIAELADAQRDHGFEEQIMDYILEHEHHEKNRYRKMWQTVTGIAASVIIVLGGFLFYQQQNQQAFKDTFNNPDEAYAYAEQTLRFVSAKYNRGLSALASFDKLQKAEEPLKKNIAPLSEFFENVKKMNNPSLASPQQ